MSKTKRFFKKLHLEHCRSYHARMYTRINHDYRFHHARKYHDEMADYYFKELVKLDDKS